MSLISIGLNKIKIEFYPSFFVFAAIMVALKYIEQFFILFLIVTVHEFCHILTAKKFGLSTEKIIISPIGQTAIINDIEILSLFRKILVIIIGPLSNIILFFITLIIFPDKFIFFRKANLYIALFNMLPIYPLDGGRILKFLLSNKIGIIPSNKYIMNLNFIFSIILILIGFIQVILFPFNISLICIGFYLNKIGKKEYAQMAMDFYKIVVLKNNKFEIKNNMEVKTIVYNSCSEIKDLLYKVCWDYYYIFYILHNGEIKKTITEQELVDYVLKNGISGDIAQMLN